MKYAIAIGALLSLGSLPLHLILPHAQSVQFASVLIAVIGAIYIGFALQTGSIRQIVIEACVASGFFAAALIGLWLNQWAVPIAYFLHGVWDLAHHKRTKLVAVPIWYPPFCAAYDWLFAGGIAAIWFARV